MVNEAIRICLAEKINGRLKLRDRIYTEFQVQYGLVSCFPYSVAEVAWSIAKKHKRWQRKPFAKRLMLKMDNAEFSLNYSIMSLPFKKGDRLFIPLQYGDHQESFLMDKTLKRGSVTMTESAISSPSQRRPSWRNLREGSGMTSTKSQSSEATGLCMTSLRWRDFTPSMESSAPGSPRGIRETGALGRNSRRLEERKIALTRLSTTSRP